MIQFLKFKGKCRTIGGPQKGVECEIPFIFNGKKYNGCTNEHDEDKNPWCSTNVDANRHHKSDQSQWGYCASNCPKDFGK